MGFGASLKNSRNLVAIVCLSDLLTCTQQASQIFQNIQLDVKSGRDMLQDTLEKLKKRREKCEAVFQDIFYEASEIATELGVESKKNSDNWRKAISGQSSIK